MQKYNRHDEKKQAIRFRIFKGVCPVAAAFHLTVAVCICNMSLFPPAVLSGHKCSCRIEKEHKDRYRMGGLFYNLGRKVGPKLRKGRWVWEALTGSESDAIRAEYNVGRDMARQVSRLLRHDTEPRSAELLNEVGIRLGRCVTNKHRRFSFEVVKSSRANAFALPGGFIFVTGPLLELCQWDADEVAFVLAHEMAHVIRGHALERIISDSAFAAALAGTAGGTIAAWLRKVGIKFLESAYSQDRELDADELAVRLIAVAGYDTGGAPKLLSRLAGLSQSDKQFDLSGYFSSHPAFDIRIKKVVSAAAGN